MKTLNNTVIANRKKTDWTIIKKYFEDRGVDIRNYIGCDIETKYCDSFYYGIIGCHFSNYSDFRVKQANATILEVGDIDKEFKVGDVVVVTQNTDEQGKITKITSISKNHSKYFDLKHCELIYRSNQIRHATPEEINQYKGIYDTVTLPKSFVLEAHKSACSDWKKRIEEVVPELFVNKFVTGWVVDEKEHNWIGYRENGILKYGFSSIGWFVPSDCEAVFCDTERPATEQEVFEALKKEAIKRGFKEGVSFETIDTDYDKVVAKINDDKIYFDINDNHLHLGTTLSWNRYRRIFHKGTWAEIISIPTDIQSLIDKYGKEKLIEILRN